MTELRNDMQTIEFCRLQFNFKLPSEQIAYRGKKLVRYQLDS